MKIKTQSQLARCTIDGTQISLPEEQSIDLEFSTIDTGSGFKDPILDFSFSLEIDADAVGISHESGTGDRNIEVTLQNPDNGREASFAFSGPLQFGDSKTVEVNGRLKDENISRDVIGFMLQLLR